MADLNKFMSYDVKGLKKSIQEAEEVPDYHDPKYFDYMKKKQREAPVPEAKVEKYKVTKEMLAFSKQYKKIQKLSQVLQQGLQIQLGEADETRRMLHETQALTQGLLQNLPKTPTHEVEGQELGPEDLQIRY